MGALDLQLPFSTIAPAPEQGQRRVSVDLVTESSNSLWITMEKDADGAAQKFSLPMLGAFRGLLRQVREHGGKWPSMQRMETVHYAILRSAHPLYFNLGGDLEHFRDCIQRRDRDTLYRYSKLCMDIMYEWATSLNEHLTTIALVQGRALGGGFEAALSADFIVAEEHAEFGFPEILFGLFPCTGGMSLLARRVGVHEAERMMTNGKVYSARELHDKGIVDVLCPTGEGSLAVQRFMATHAKHRAARQALQRSRHRVAPLDHAELLKVVEEWVEAAMVLPESEIRVMDMLARMQRQAPGA